MPAGTRTLAKRGAEGRHILEDKATRRLTNKFVRVWKRSCLVLGPVSTRALISARFPLRFDALQWEQSDVGRTAPRWRVSAKPSNDNLRTLRLGVLMWNRFLPNSSSFRAKFVGASLTLGASALLAVSCSSSTPDNSGGSGGSGNSPSAGGKSSSGGAPATCTGTVCGGSCVDTKSSTSNCGMCGNACTGATPFCSNGSCSSMCTNTLCGTNCVNLLTDAANCNACNVACAVGQTCSGGVCMGVVGTGGSGPGTGGTSGTAGGGTVTGGNGSGGGGTVIPPGRNGCAVKPGMVSDFEEGTAATDPVVIASEGRSGTWGIFNDASKMTEMMKVESSGGTADCDKFALHVTGSGYNDYVGFGMVFAGTDKAPVLYDAAAKNFTGVRFKAKLGSGADSKSPVRFNLSTPFTEE